MIFNKYLDLCIIKLLLFSFYNGQVCIYTVYRYNNNIAKIHLKYTKRNIKSLL